MISRVEVTKNHTRIKKEQEEVTQRDYAASKPNQHKD